MTPRWRLSESPGSAPQMVLGRHEAIIEPDGEGGIEVSIDCGETMRGIVIPAQELADFLARCGFWSTTKERP